MTALLLSALSGGVLRLTLSDAASRNSLSEAMMAALREALDAAAGDKAVRVIVLAGEGPAFSSGHNLKEITARRADADKGAAYFASLFGSCAELMLGIVNNPKPVIAEVAGLASAAGCQLVASCDLAIAGEGAGFCTPGVNIGLFCSTPMVALSRNLSSKHAMEMLLTGDVFGAGDALRFGLVNRVVPAAQLTAAVNALAAKIAAKSMVTVKTGKQAFYRQRDLPLAEAYAYTARVMTENLLRRDAEEGIAAFIAKRPPDWTDEP
ncbi:MAG: enoyl-CoA hydratase [Aestuariivirga sp.]|uniref:enoyl-CoA hydratase n=1 Tax=Aestuariivirga sp. TaxID=2650926 RepID=UPI0025C052CB|nr:enoyl-CoA hydratase [Aestuariivirga sp.]MCA3561290.1 enoyl-CoA hydratase [Aestuariivirga sp.]